MVPDKQLPTQGSGISKKGAQRVTQGPDNKDPCKLPEYLEEERALSDQGARLADTPGCKNM